MLDTSCGVSAGGCSIARYQTGFAGNVEISLSNSGVIFIGVSHTVGLIRLGQPTLKI
jgi:hypothetical protein